MPKHVRFDSFGTPSPTFSSSSLSSSPGPVTPPPLGMGSPYHTAPLPPIVHQALAASRPPLASWDMSLPPPYLPSDIWAQAATQPPVGSMQITHPLLPWRITIQPSIPGTYVTVGDVFNSLYMNLSTAVKTMEFDLLPSRQRKNAVNDASLYRWKQQSNYSSEQYRGVTRVDFLEGKSEFGGLAYSKEGQWALITS